MSTSDVARPARALDSRSEARDSAVGLRELLLAGLPIAERRLDLAGVGTAVLEGGDGPPIVLLHGPGEHAAKWLRIIPKLVKSHHVIAPDLPGHGASGAIVGEIQVERVLSWLAELIRHTCPTPPALVGQIIGGAIAARFAAGRSDQLRRMILSDSLGLAPFCPAPEFAEALTAFLAGPEAAAITGVNLPVDCGWLVTGSWHTYGGLRRPS